MRASSAKGTCLRVRPSCWLARMLPFLPSHEGSAIDCCNRARTRIVDRDGNPLNIRPHHRLVDRGHDEHREGKAGELLLAFYVLVAGQEDVELLAFNEL